MSRMSTLVPLLLALVCMLGFIEAARGHSPKAYKAARAVRGPEYSSSLRGSTEEDALHAESRLKTRGVYHEPDICNLLLEATRNSECYWQTSGRSRSKCCNDNCSEIAKLVRRIASYTDANCGPL